MDLDRVGVTGVSWGGYGSLRALLLYPDFFKVAVSAAAPGAWLDFYSGVSVERWFGIPSESPEARAYYDLVSNTRLAPRLKGKLLLIYGGVDENVPLKNAFEVIDAFVEADKDFDLLILPNAEHNAFEGVPYGLKRGVRYFVEHLGSGSRR
jgi:dipeptidyl-peptidase 4